MLQKLRPGLRNLSDRIKHLPRDHRGYPIPWFVYRDVHGVADFRIIGPGKVELATKRDLCWVCGTKLARHKTFVIGPMCAINRVSAEPPMHKSCATFAATNCPFLTMPRMRRNTNELPPEGYTLEGAQPHNPGAVVVWITRSYTVMPVERGVLFRIGEPEEVRWFANGRAAERGEVIEAMEKGMPVLIDIAQREGEESVRKLMQQIVIARRLIPARGGSNVGEDAA